MATKVMIFSSVHQYDDSRIFHKQAVSLVNAGYDVELHAVADFNQKVQQGVRIYGVKPVNKKYTRIKRGLELYRRALKSGADIFHFHDPELLPWGVLLQKKTGKPVIYDAHEDVPKQIYTKPWIPRYLRGFVSRIVHFIEKTSARALAQVIAATEEIAKQFKEVQDVVIIKNYPLPMKVNEQDERDEYREGSANKESNRILYIGGISYLRGYNEMIQMMEYLPQEFQAELHMIGPIQHIRKEDRDKEELQKKNVFLHGRVPFQEVKSWLSKGRIGLVCLHPTQSYLDSLPIKMFEYMAAGLPVIASNFPLWQEIVQGNACGFSVDPLNPEEMASKVEELLKDPLLYEKQSENGVRAFQEKYNWKVEEEKLLSLYSKLS